MSRDERKLGGNGNARLYLKVDDLLQAVEYLGMKGIRVSEIHNVENGKLACLKTLMETRSAYGNTNETNQVR